MYNNDYSMCKSTQSTTAEPPNIHLSPGEKVYWLEMQGQGDTAIL